MELLQTEKQIFPLVPTGEITRLAAGMVVEDERGAITATEFLGQVGDHLKKVETARKAAVGPMNEEMKRINSAAKALTEPLEAAKATVSAKVLAHHRRQQELVRQEEERQRQIEKERQEAANVAQEAERRRAQHEADAELAADRNSEGQFDAAVEQANAQAEAAAQARLQEAELAAQRQAVAIPGKSFRAGSGALSSVKWRWVFRVTDTEAIPRQWLVLDETAVRRAVAAGVRDIPGIEIYQEDSLAVRA